MLTQSHFWRSTPLSAREHDLLIAVLAAHAESAKRGNVSTWAAQQIAQSSGNYAQAIAAAILTTGGLHAPLEQTVRLLCDPSSANRIIDGGGLVAGWGNSFVKGEKDPIWREVDSILDCWPVSAKIRSITEFLHSRGKLIYPNPSAYTAAAAIALGIPARVAGYLFLAGRIEAWTSMIADQWNDRKEI